MSEESTATAVPPRPPTRRCSRGRRSRRNLDRRRLKFPIGYQAGIKLLRAGAHLIVTTRFPRDSAARYAAEPDFSQWSDRLINNACQTVRRPPEFCRHMMELETPAIDRMSDPARKQLGAYEGARAYNMLPESGASLSAGADRLGHAAG